MSEPERRISHQRLALRYSAVVLMMFGFGYVMVPIYDVLCDLTGLNGKTGREVESELNYQVDEQREVTVEFMSVTNEAMPWEFRPVVNKLKVYPGKVYQTSYRVRNPTSRVMIGQAVPSVVPAAAASHFNKTECFCFTEQVLQPGEEVEMPLRFIVTPELPGRIGTVTLSYTFFDITSKVSLLDDKTLQTSRITP